MNSAGCSVRTGTNLIVGGIVCLLAQGVLVSPKMVEDHSCLTLVAALREASAHMGGGTAAEYFPPTVPGTDDASAGERAGDSKGGDAAVLSAVL